MRCRTSARADLALRTLALGVQSGQNACATIELLQSSTQSRANPLVPPVCYTPPHPGPAPRQRSTPPEARERPSSPEQINPEAYLNHTSVNPNPNLALALTPNLTLTLTLTLTSAATNNYRVIITKKAVLVHVILKNNNCDGLFSFWLMLHYPMHKR